MGKLGYFDVMLTFFNSKFGCIDVSLDSGEGTVTQPLSADVSGKSLSCINHTDHTFSPGLRHPDVAPGGFEHWAACEGGAEAAGLLVVVHRVDGILVLMPCGQLGRADS